ncbi:MarR family winged helix-turn-helix transcriptional regulator [Pseudonocardia spinosispora]|uniref:MarR family winged helix-turn-helix transcriptional regulator n=1 Tax=Pseudonocardia spinosispora TaxID=103441 RepID=UPI000418FC02|nr:MarR family transcriptional regulator [Pseudonocardia spinosispora]
MGETETRAPLLVFSTTMRLIAVGREMQRKLEAELAELGLTMRHLGALGHLSHRPDLSYSDLARRSGVTAPSMLATVRALESLGAVSRTSSGQGRAAQLEITTSGRELLAKVRTIVADLDGEFLGPFDEDQRAALDAILAANTKPPSR